MVCDSSRGGKESRPHVHVQLLAAPVASQTNNFYLEYHMAAQQYQTDSSSQLVSSTLL